MKNLTSLFDQSHLDKERKYKVSQKKDFAPKLETARSLVPLFFGYNGIDYRGLLTNKALSDSGYFPGAPTLEDYGHISYEDIDYLYWPNNIDVLLQRTGETSINGYPSPVSEVLEGFEAVKILRKHYLAEEKKLLAGVVDEATYDRLNANYNRKACRYALDKPQSDFIKGIRFQMPDTAWIKRNSKFSGSMRFKPSIALKEKILRSYHSDPSIKRVVNTFGLPYKYIESLVRRSKWSNLEGGSMLKHTSYSRKVDANVRLLVSKLSLTLYPNNSASAIRLELQREWEGLDLSISTIQRILKAMGHSYTRRNEVKRYCNSAYTKKLRKNFAARLLRLDSFDYFIVYFDEKPISSQTRSSKCWGTRGKTNWFEKSYTKKTGSLLMSTCSRVQLPIMIHEGYTTVFVVWCYLRAVLTHVRDLMQQDMERVIIVMDDHSSHIPKFLVKGLYKEFDMFKIVVTVKDSPQMMPQELLNRFVAQKAVGIDMQSNPEWWREYVNIVCQIDTVYYIYALQWFVTNCLAALDEKDLY